MKCLHLPDRAYLQECFDYDLKSGALTWRSRPSGHFVDERARKIWNTKHAGTGAGILSRGRFLVSVNNIKYKAHRIIWKWMTGNDPREVVDHKNLDAQDNSWDNLREATHSQNHFNSPGHDGHIYPKGVSPFRDGWQAQIQAHGKRRHLGFYPTPEEAHAAYTEAAQQLHGEFANTGEKLCLR